MKQTQFHTTEPSPPAKANHLGTNMTENHAGKAAFSVQNTPETKEAPSPPAKALTPLRPAHRQRRRIAKARTCRHRRCLPNLFRSGRAGKAKPGWLENLEPKWQGYGIYIKRNLRITTVPPPRNTRGVSGMNGRTTESCPAGEATEGGGKPP